MDGFDPEFHPHRRWNPLTGEWVLASPQRGKRPWQGKVETTRPPGRPPYDPNCYLCPGNQRAGGNVNPDYTGTFVFDNDFPGLLPDTPPPSSDPDGETGATPDLLRMEPEPGRCRVICFSPRHDLTLPRMESADLRGVVDVWIDETRTLGDSPAIGYVQVFENKGEIMGCSNPHPHGQVWASRTLPDLPAKEDGNQRRHLSRHGECLLCAYLRVEEADGRRIVCANDHFVALVPFWAVWPFETLLLPRRHLGALPDLDDGERDALAEILKRLTCRYDNLFETSFPYSMGFHQQPTDGNDHWAWHLHAHFYPPLLRSATIRKFMVGYEMLAAPQRDLTAEDAAARLRELSEKHYLDR